MDPKISFLKSTSKNYLGVQQQLIDLITPHLPEGSWVETPKEPDHAKLNIAFFISRHAHVLMSHGVADKNYFTRKDDTGKRILNRFQYGFVPGNWLRNKLINHSAIEMPAENIHIVGWPRLDLLTKLRAQRPPSKRLRVLWAPTHNYQNRNGRVLSSFPDFEQYLPALSEHFDVTASPHPRNRPDKTPTTEKMAHCDVLISDFGTTVYEALALGIPVIFPDWLIRDGITSVFSKSSPAQLFKQNIGYHPQNFDELMDILKAGPVIDDKTKAFIDNVIDPETVGRSGEITARKLVELSQLPLKDLPLKPQDDSEDTDPDLYARERNGTASKRHQKSANVVRRRLVKAGHSAEVVEKFTELECYANRAPLYGLTDYLAPDYLTDAERHSTHTLNGAFKIILRNKLLSYQVLSDYIRTPRVYASVTDGAVDFCDDVIYADAPLKLFFKPTKGAGGKSAFALDLVGGKCPDNRPISSYMEDLLSRKRSFLVLERVQQNDFMASLFPHSVNTVRMLSFRDPKTRKPIVARGIIRVGTEATAPVDNFSKGGISFHLDLETGCIGTGKSKYINEGREFLSAHPDTGVRITGLKLPGLDDLIRLAEKLHAHLPKINYIGWDFCLSPDGPVLIEANNTTDVDIFQIHEPLLRHGGLRGFYREHGII